MSSGRVSSFARGPVARFFRTAPGRVVNRPWLSRHQVEPNAGGWFDVTSGNSGEVYRVTPKTPTYAECECIGFKKSPAPCSHVRAVWEFAEMVMQEIGR